MLANGKHHNADMDPNRCSGRITIERLYAGVSKGDCTLVLEGAEGNLTAKRWKSVGRMQHNSSGCAHSGTIYKRQRKRTLIMSHCQQKVCFHSNTP
jgi:hypothetical protein